MRITCLINDNYQGTPNPLVYVVDVPSPVSREATLWAVTEARMADLGFGKDEELDLELLMAFEGEPNIVADWRDFTGGL